MKSYTELAREEEIYQQRGQGCFISKSVSRFSEEGKNRIIDKKARAMIIEALHLGYSSEAFKRFVVI